MTGFEPAARADTLSGESLRRFRAFYLPLLMRCRTVNEMNIDVVCSLPCTWCYLFLTNMLLSYLVLFNLSA